MAQFKALNTQLQLLLRIRVVPTIPRRLQQCTREKAVVSHVERAYNASDNRVSCVCALFCAVLGNVTLACVRMFRTRPFLRHAHPRHGDRARYPKHDPHALLRARSTVMPRSTRQRSRAGSGGIVLGCSSRLQPDPEGAQKEKHTWKRGCRCVSDVLADALMG